MRSGDGEARALNAGLRAARGVKTGMTNRGFRPRILAAVAAAALTAGLAAAAPAGAATFSSPVVVTGDDTGEPGIDVAKDGTIYVNAPSGLLSSLPGSASFVYRSDDGGTSWSKLPAGQRGNLPGGGDSDISLDPATGKIYMTDLWLGSSTVSTSTDKGQTWTANPVEGTPVQDRQWISTPGNNIAYHLTHQIPGGLVVSKSVDGGLTYPIRTVAATPVDQTGCVCPPGTLISEAGTSALGLGDKVGFVYATSSGGVNFARSTNGATTFTQSTVGPASSADTGQAFPVVANGGGGRLAAVWMAVAGGQSQVELSTSTNWGSTWSAPRTIVSAGTSLYPWVDARGSKVAVSLYHTDAAGEPGTVPESAQWYESYLESTDGGATFSALQQADPTAVKSGPVCTEGINCSGDRELLDFQSVALDGSSLADLAYTRSIDGASNTELRFAHEG
jgi:hypothetical protein